MNHGQARLIILLLAAILFVLLVGQGTALGLLGTAFYAGLIVLVIGLLLAAIVGLVRGTKREVLAYKQEIARDRAEGRPWLHNFVTWPGIIGNFLVFGIATKHYFARSCDVLTDDCLHQVAYWWLPVSLIFLGILVLVGETLFLRLRR